MAEAVGSDRQTLIAASGPALAAAETVLRAARVKLLARVAPNGAIEADALDREQARDTSSETTRIAILPSPSPPCWGSAMRSSGCNSAASSLPFRGARKSS